MSRLILTRLAKLVVLSAGLLSTRTYVSAQGICPGTWCLTQGVYTCCSVGYGCCSDNGGWCCNIQ
jgi:hypothetical protein